jgi:hypothetical protein
MNQYSRCWLVFETLFLAPAPKILFRQHRPNCDIGGWCPPRRSADGHGLEDDFDWSNIGGSTTSLDCAAGCSMPGGTGT